MYIYQHEWLMFMVISQVNIPFVPWMRHGLPRLLLNRPVAGARQKTCGPCHWSTTLQRRYGVYRMPGTTKGGRFLWGPEDRGSKNDGWVDIGWNKKLGRKITWKKCRNWDIFSKDWMYHRRSTSHVLWTYDGFYVDLYCTVWYWHIFTYIVIINQGVHGNAVPISKIFPYPQNFCIKKWRNP